MKAKDNSDNSDKKREYLDYLQDISESIEKATSFTQGMDYEAFQNHDKTVYATIRALEVIGEATKKIPTSIREEYTEVPWREMAGIRDKLIHDYFGVNMEVVWKTVKQDLPDLRPQIKKVIKENSP